MHDAWFRLAGGSGLEAADRNEFLKFAARAMRSLVVDHARRRSAEKRGGGRMAIAIDAELAAWEDRGVDVLSLHDCLGRLEQRDAQLARVVELRFFAGLTTEETGDVLGLSRRQVQHAWLLARSWLHRELSRAG